MQTVSFETAKELKEAGFPQPAQRMGQWWYDEKGRITLTAFDDSFGDMAAEVMKQYTYAPTTTDLIPHNWMLARHGSQWECIEENELDNFFSNGFAPKNLFTNDNPSEAAAQAWLFVNRNQSNV